MTSVVGIIGIVLIVTGIITNWRRTHGIDFAQFYIPGKLFAQARPIYDVNSQQEAITRYAPETQGRVETMSPTPYPPSVAILVCPLTIFTYASARRVWLVIELGTLLAGMWRLSVVFASQWGIESRLLMLGVILHSITIRWGLELLQTAPLALGLLGFFIAALVQNRRLTAFLCALLAICLKFTLAPPFLMLALFTRRYRLFASVIITALLINIFGFARAGGWKAVHGFRQSLARLEMFPVNSPDPHIAASAERVDWQYLLNGLHSNPPLARTMNLVFTLIAVIWLVIQWRQIRHLAVAPQQIIVFLGPFVCLTLLCIYHHVPDASLLLAPALLYLTAHSAVRKMNSVKFFLGATLFYVCLRPSFREIGLVLGLLLHNDPQIIEKTLGSHIIALMFIASLWTLHRYTREAKFVHPAATSIEIS